MCGTGACHRKDKICLYLKFEGKALTVHYIIVCSLFVSFVCLFLFVRLTVCPSVCLTVSDFSQPCFNLYFGHTPWYCPPPMPIQSEVDQDIVIRLISLMNKLLKGPIYWKRYQIGILLLLNLDWKS